MVCDVWQKHQGTLTFIPWVFTWIAMFQFVGHNYIKNWLLERISFVPKLNLFLLKLHFVPTLSVAVMSQIGILTPDWSIAAVPCYSPEWKIAFGVNDEANKIRVCSKIISWNNFLFKMLSTMISYNCVSRKFHYIRSETIEIRQNLQHSIDTQWKVSLQCRGVCVPNSTTATDRTPPINSERNTIVTLRFLCLNERKVSLVTICAVI